LLYTTLSFLNKGIHLLTFETFVSVFLMNCKNIDPWQDTALPCFCSIVEALCVQKALETYAPGFELYGSHMFSKDPLIHLAVPTWCRKSGWGKILKLALFTLIKQAQHCSFSIDCEYAFLCPFMVYGEHVIVPT